MGKAKLTGLEEDMGQAGVGRQARGGDRPDSGSYRAVEREGTGQR